MLALLLDGPYEGESVFSLWARTRAHTHADSGGYRKRPSSVHAYMPPYPPFEATPPGSAPGLPVKPGHLFVASGAMVSEWKAAIPQLFHVVRFSSSI